MKSTAIYRTVAVAGLCVLVAAGTTAAQEVPIPEGEERAPLTLAEAIDLAERNNPAFRQQLNDVGPAAWGVRSATADLFLPQADVSFGTAWQDGGSQRLGGATFPQPAILLSQWSFGLNYRLDGTTLFTPGQRRAERTAIERRIDNAEMGLRNQVTSAYLEVLRLQERAEQAARELRRSEEHLRLAEAREQVGAGTRLETMQADVTRGQAEIALLQARNAARVSKLRLVQALGVELAAERIELTSEFEVFEPELEADGLLRQAMSGHPTLVASRASRDAANASVKVARSAYFPSLSLSARWSGFTREETDPDVTVAQQVNAAEQEALQQRAACNEAQTLYNEVGLEPPVSDCSMFAFTQQDSTELAREFKARNDQFPFDFNNEPLTLSASLSFPVFTGFQRQMNLEQSIAQRNDLAHQTRALELQVRTDVTEAIHNLETAYQTVRLQEENTERAREEMRLARERYELGAGTFLELLDSQTLAAQAEVDQIEAVYSFHQALAALEAAVGRPLELRGSGE